MKEKKPTQLNKLFPSPNLNSDGVYCSLDIETSGFDPLKNEVLEVGLVFFTLGEGQAKIIEEYTRVFKPSQPVPANILGLTGISQTELDEAELFEDHKAELQQKLKEAVIVGHNVVFDMTFLQSVGIKFSGKVIDTLDLVQFILPTHHSYNLENLMHTFAVSHQNAHRALADANACLVVLEKLLQVYGDFPEKLKQQIVAIASEQGFEWVNMLATSHAEAVFKNSASKPLGTLATSGQIPKLVLKSHTIYNFPLGKSCVEDLVGALGKQKKKVLLVLPKMSQVMNLWRRGQAQGIFSPEVLFNETKFQALLAKDKYSNDEAKFILKVLVWKFTNWQTECIFDLNLSFFGGQFRSLITGGKLAEEAESKLLCCDVETFHALTEQKFYRKRFVVIVGLNEFEQYISTSLSAKVSWSYIAYILKTFYNPELQTGNITLKETVSQGLAKADLFFGLVHALLKSEEPFQYFAFNKETFETHTFAKLTAAADNFATGLLELNKNLKSAEVEKFAADLRAFFVYDGNSVKWLELAESRCVLLSTPLDIAPEVKKVVKQFKELAFADSLGNANMLDYFVQRLGLGKFAITQVGKTKQQPSLQGELFAGLAELGLSKKHTIACTLSSKSLSSEDLATLVQNSPLPAAILFATVSQVKAFYESNFTALQKHAFLVAQTNAGGSNKMFHNFAIHSNSLLLATGKLILKHRAGSSSVDPVEHLPVKTLIICHLPFEQYTHPYQQAVSSRFANPFEDYSLPKAVYNFHTLLEFFNTELLERIYICDSKLAKNYGNVFKEYISQIPSLTFE